MKDRISFKDSSTLSEYLEKAGQDTISDQNLSLLENLGDGIIINAENILYDYIEELESVSYEYTMYTDETFRYYMRPDLYAYDKWGNKDYAFIILIINGMASPKEFTETTIKTINKDIIGKVLGIIISAEQEYINFNREKFMDETF